MSYIAVARFLSSRSIVRFLLPPDMIFDLSVITVLLRFLMGLQFIYSCIIYRRYPTIVTQRSHFPIPFSSAGCRRSSLSYASRHYFLLLSSEDFDDRFFLIDRSLSSSSPRYTSPEMCTRGIQRLSAAIYLSDGDLSPRGFSIRTICDVFTTVLMVSRCALPQPITIYILSRYPALPPFLVPH